MKKVQRELAEAGVPCRVSSLRVKGLLPTVEAGEFDPGYPQYPSFHVFMHVLGPASNGERAGFMKVCVNRAPCDWTYYGGTEAENFEAGIAEVKRLFGRQD